MKGAGRPQKRMTPQRWQIVGGYAFAILNVTILDFTVSPAHSLWSWWTLLAVAVFGVSYKAGSYGVRQWQRAI